MAEHTNTGSIATTDTGSIAVNAPVDPTQRRVYRTIDGVVETTLITRGEYKAYRTEGWSIQDPAFTTDSELIKLAEANDGVVPIHSNLGGIPKQVSPDEVLWHLQNGWSLDS